LAFLPEHIAKHSSLLQKLEGLEFDSKMGIWVLTHGDLRFQSRVRKFMTFISERLQALYPEYSC